MAKKDLGVKPYLFPMPVLMIATYCEDGSVDVMNMAGYMTLEDIHEVFRKSDKDD